MKAHLLIQLLSFVSVGAFIIRSRPIPNEISLRIKSRNSFRNEHAHGLLTSRLHSSLSSSSTSSDREVDVVVIGAGIGGLSCAALSAKYNLDTICVEAHDTPGGVAHSFDRYNAKASSSDGANKMKVPFRFDSGPSLISGLSSKSTNPLRQVLDAVGTADEIEWRTYDGWIVHDYADGKSFKLTTGDGGEFEKAIEEKAGIESRKEFERFKSLMLAKGGLTEASGYIPPFALRGGWKAASTLKRYFLKFLSIGTKGLLLTGPFTVAMDKYKLNDEFNRKWYDYLAFALSGLDAAHTQAAPVAYTIGDLHKPGSVLDYPMGGMDSLIQALVKGLTKHGGEMRLNTRVEKLLLVEKDGSALCEGVVLNDGSVVRARKGVVCNAPLWNMARILEDSIIDQNGDPRHSESSVIKAVDKIKEQADSMEMTGSFMHLHLGIAKDGISEDLECHHSVLNFDEDITAEQNLVIISIPTVFDPSLAPKGYHIVHAYTAASENFDDWVTYMDDKKETFKVGSSPNSAISSRYNKAEGYEKLKAEKAEALWKAVECVIPDVRERAKREDAVVLIGSPLTHRRYNQRARGTYGPAPAPGKDVWELPGPITPIGNLLACGDTTFPGIGLPGVAASGTVAANTLVDVDMQLDIMNELKRKGALQ